MSNIEFRFVYDCESMEKVLQHRTVHNSDSKSFTATEWQTVPTVLGVIHRENVLSVNNGNKK